MDKHPIESIMTTTMENIKDMVDVNTVIGDPVQTLDGSTIIPLSRVCFGFVAGGGEYTVGGTPVPLEVTDDPLPFAGGTGAGVSVNPVAFLIVKDGSVRLLPVAPPAGDSVGRVVDLVPEMFEKVTGYIDKKTGTDKSGE